jgi:hypothetical protein
MRAAQSTVSKVETGEQKRVPASLIVRWAKATGATGERLAELLELNEQTQVGPGSWEAASETGSTDLGPATADLENKTRLLSNYRPATVPGLLQTPAYARRLLCSGPAGGAGRHRYPGHQPDRAAAAPFTTRPRPSAS